MSSIRRLGVIYQNHTQNTLEHIQSLCQTLHITVDAFPYHAISQIDKENLTWDFLISMGGDGTLLRSVPFALACDIPIVGIHHGRLGFLADINPIDLETELKPILQGCYHIEPRSMLQIHTHRGIWHGLNEILWSHDQTQQMLSWSLSIDGVWVCDQHADGWMIVTPTGSTAYALSGGGPIIHPQSQVFLLMSMFSHTLNMRPLIISDTSKVECTLTSKNPVRIVIDGTCVDHVRQNETCLFEKSPKTLKVAHPIHYQYFQTLRTKLNWNHGSIRQIE